MAITKNINDSEWEFIYSIIRETILKRKLQFKKEDILSFIKKEFINKEIDISIMDYAYFQILFLNVLDEFIDNGILYVINDIYFPVEYIIFNDYHTKFSSLFYFNYDEAGKPIYLNLHTLEEKAVLNNRDFLLTGGFDNDTRRILTPKIELREIIGLYQSFINEGSSKEDAINHILNYYDIKKIASSDYLCNIVIIDDKDKKKKRLRERKKDNN